MKIFGVLVTVIVVGWGAVKAVSASRQGAGSSADGRPACPGCLRWHLPPAGPAFADHRTAAAAAKPSAVPAAGRTRCAAPRPRTRHPSLALGHRPGTPLRHRGQRRRDTGPSPAPNRRTRSLLRLSGSQGSGTLSGKPGRRPGLARVPGSGPGILRRPAGRRHGCPRGAVPLAGRAPSGPARTAVPPWLRAPHVQLPSASFFPALGCSAGRPPGLPVLNTGAAPAARPGRDS